MMCVILAICTVVSLFPDDSERDRFVDLFTKVFQALAIAPHFDEGSRLVA